MVMLDRPILNDVLDNMVWSFSRLNSFYQCKRGWYYTYILGRSTKDNFFSEYGSFVHSILERYNNGKIELFDILKVYDDEFDIAITHEAPPNDYVDLYTSYYRKGRKFFENFDGYSDETLGAEMLFTLYKDVLGSDRKIIGYIDRVSRDNNGIIVTDYKSKSSFKNDKELKKYARQLYIYAMAIKEIYGEYPYKMVFDQFRVQKKIEIPFNVSDMNETDSWISDTICKIYEEETYDMECDDFFCNYLCGVGYDVCSV